MRDLIAALAASRPDKVFWVDSRLRPEHFRRVIVKPNQHEAEEACPRTLGKTDYSALRSLTGSPLLLVTQGAGGVLLVQETAETLVPTIPIPNPVDICGAGDSFSAGAAVALSITRD